ncbi:hypothetical protein GCM10029964_108300 [Kibdelosporangium lantanae]
MTVIPNGWQLKPCTATDYCAQADDPTDAARFLRLGATSAHPESPLVVQTAYEKEFSTGRVNFQRVKLDAVAHRGHEAVDWEFEYDLNGVRRHVKTLLWRADGEDNWVYASAELTRWPETREIYDRMVDAATPERHRIPGLPDSVPPDGRPDLTGPDLPLLPAEPEHDREHATGADERARDHQRHEVVGATEDDHQQSHAHGHRLRVPHQPGAVADPRVQLFRRRELPGIVGGRRDPFGDGRADIEQWPARDDEPLVPGDTPDLVGQAQQRPGEV